LADAITGIFVTSLFFLEDVVARFAAGALATIGLSSVAEAGFLADVLDVFLEVLFDCMSTF
jgi:hypothetical protein